MMQTASITPMAVCQGGGKNGRILYDRRLGGLAAEAAGVVELVDAPDSKSGSARSVGSIPTARTSFFPDKAGRKRLLFLKKKKQQDASP